MKFDVIVIGGDPKDAQIGLEYISEGKAVAMIAFGGIVHDPHSRDGFAAAGGTLFCNDRVARVEFSSDGSAVERLFTENLGNTPLEAESYVLATGRFVTGGLLSDMDSVYEPVFGSDVDFIPDHRNWCTGDFFDKQPFEDFGVLVDSDGHVLKDGKPVKNLSGMGGVLAARFRK